MPKNSGIFLGLNPSRFQVHISVPDTDEECCITLDRLSEYQLEFMQGAHSFVQNRPNLAKASLPCGHSFSALALLYHFANNTMACPCCRAGRIPIPSSRVSRGPCPYTCFTSCCFTGQ